MIALLVSLPISIESQIYMIYEHGALNEAYIFLQRAPSPEIKSTPFGGLAWSLGMGQIHKK